MILADRRMVLIGAGLALLGALGGCQTTRYHAPCAAPEQAGYSATVAPVPDSNRARNPPYLHGESVPVPLATPEERSNRPALPPAPVEKPQARGFGGGPALNVDPDEMSDDDADDDDRDDDDRGTGEPVFPKGGLRSLRVPSQPSASVNPPGRATLSSSTDDIEASAALERAPRYPLPVTRRLPSRMAVPRETSADVESHSMPIPLSDPPALLTPPSGS